MSGMLAILLLAPSAAATTVAVPLADAHAAGWVEDAIRLASDVVFTSLGIVWTAAAAICNAATAACPL